MEQMKLRWRALGLAATAGFSLAVFAIIAVLA